jgi:alkylation response protein AidB-like acyl-CoA dehydrogenase
VPPLFQPPEPDLSEQEMIDRAIALRPLLRETQAETEKRTYVVDEVQQAYVDAGFYRLYVPRRFGGYEFDVTTFMRVVLELHGATYRAPGASHSPRRMLSRSPRGGPSRLRTKSSATATSGPPQLPRRLDSPPDRVRNGT